MTDRSAVCPAGAPGHGCRPHTKVSDPGHGCGPYTQVRDSHGSCCPKIHEIVGLSSLLLSSHACLGRYPNAQVNAQVSVVDPGCLSRIRGSGIFLPDPGSDFFPSRILDPNFSSRIRFKEFKYFNPKEWFLSSRKYDPDCSSRIRILTFYPHRIPDPGVKKAPDPGSGSATLAQVMGAWMLLSHAGQGQRASFTHHSLVF